MEHHSFECKCGARSLKVDMAVLVLVVPKGALAVVKEINGSSYAVLKRSLLSLGRLKSP